MLRYLGKQICSLKSYSRVLKTPETRLLRRFSIFEAKQNVQFDIDHSTLIKNRRKIIKDLDGKDSQRIKQIIDAYALHNELDEELSIAIQSWIVSNLQSLSDLEFATLLTDISASGNAFTSVVAYENRCLKMLQQTDVADYDQIISFISLIARNMVAGNKLSHRFIEDFKSRVEDLWEGISLKAKVDCIEIVLASGSTKSVENIPQSWLRCLQDISTVEEMFTAFGLIEFLYIKERRDLIPDYMITKLKQRGVVDENTTSLNIFILRILGYESRTGGVSEGEQTKQFNSFVNHTVEELEDMFIDDLSTSISFILGYLESYRLPIRHINDELQRLIKGLGHYIEENNNVFNLEETLKMLSRLMELLKITGSPLSPQKQIIKSLLVSGAECLENEENYQLVVSYFQFLTHLANASKVELFDSEDSNDIAKKITKYIPLRRYTISQYMEIGNSLAKLIQHNLKLSNFAKSDLGDIVECYAGISLDLKYLKYDDLVKVLTLLDRFSDDYPKINLNQKAQLIEKFK